MKNHVCMLPILLALLFLSACTPPQPVAGVSGPPAPPTPPGSESAPPPPPPASEPARSSPEGIAGIAGTGLLEEVQGSRPPTAAPSPEPQQPETELVEAKKGVGLKGRSLDPYEGVVVTPAKTYFAAKERIAFEVQVPHALQLYEAANGKAPQTHQEFMDEIIKANGIKLPVLPPGHEYVYNVETKQLMVKRPKK